MNFVVHCWIFFFCPWAARVAIVLFNSLKMLVFFRRFFFFFFFLALQAKLSIRLFSSVTPDTILVNINFMRLHHLTVFGHLGRMTQTSWCLEKICYYFYFFTLLHMNYNIDRKRRKEKATYKTNSLCGQGIWWGYFSCLVLFMKSCVDFAVCQRAAFVVCLHDVFQYRYQWSSEDYATFGHGRACGYAFFAWFIFNKVSFLWMWETLTLQLIWGRRLTWVHRLPCGLGARQADHHKYR